MTDLSDFTRFAKVPVAVIGSDIWRHRPSLLTYLVIASRVRYVRGPAMVGPRVLDLDVGQAVIGRSEVARLCQLTEAQVRTALVRLRKLGVIAVQSTNSGSIITLLGYKEALEAAGARSPARPPAIPPAERRRGAGRPTTNKREDVERRAEHIGKVIKFVHPEVIVKAAGADELVKPGEGSEWSAKLDELLAADDTKGKP